MTTEPVGGYRAQPLPVPATSVPAPVGYAPVAPAMITSTTDAPTLPRQVGQVAVLPASVAPAQVALASDADALPQYPTPQPTVRVPRLAWLWPTLILLALTALGGYIGLMLHRAHGITEVEAGQCFSHLNLVTSPDEPSLLGQRVDCSQPHTAEVIAVINPPSEIREGSILDWPHVSAAGNAVVGGTGDVLAEWPTETCNIHFEEYVGIPASDSELTLLSMPIFTSAMQITNDEQFQNALDHDSWRLVCIVGHPESTGTIRNANR